MLKVIGTQGCSRCAMIKNILTKKEIRFDYFLFDELDSESQDNYLKASEQTGKMVFPILVQDGIIIDFKDIQ